MGSLSKKTAVLVGAHSLIMQSVAKRFASEGTDGICVISDKQNETEWSASAGETGASVICCDFRYPDSVKEAFSDACKTLGRIDILALCEDPDDTPCAIVDTDDKLWDDIVIGNQTKAFYCCRAAAGAMEEQGRGSIVFITTTAAVNAVSGGAYACAAHGLLSMCRNISIQYSGSHIRCNIVCAGPVRGAGGYEGVTGGEETDYVRKMASHVDGEIPPVAAEDVAGIVTFFASDDAMAVTGQWMAVDRGYS